MLPATLLQPAAFAALILGAAAVPGRAGRLRAAVGLPAFLLGVGSLPFLQDLHGPDPTLWISAALLLLGPAALLWETWRSRVAVSTRPLLLVSVVAAVGLTLAVAWPLLRLGGFVPALLAAGALGLGAAFLWLAAGASGLGRAVRLVDAKIPAPRQGPSYTTYLLVAAALVFGILVRQWPLWILLWQPIGVGLGVCAAWWAVAPRRPALALAGAAFTAAFLPPEFTYSAWGGLGVAALMVTGRYRSFAVALAIVVFCVITGPLLDAEAVWTVLLAGAGSALLAALAEEGAAGSA